MSAPAPEAPRALVLFGSPHPRGATAQVLAAACAMLPADWPVRTLDAYAISARPCMDCGACKAEKRCAQRDLDGFYADFERADVLLIASPVYNGGFPAPLKAVLDRMQVYYNARFCRGERPPVARPKRAALLLACGSPGGDDPERLHAQLRRMFTVLNTVSCGMYCLRGTDGGSAFDPRNGELRRILRRLTESAG